MGFLSKLTTLEIILACCVLFLLIVLTICFIILARQRDSLVELSLQKQKAISKYEESNKNYNLANNYIEKLEDSLAEKDEKIKVLKQENEKLISSALEAAVKAEKKKVEVKPIADKKTLIEKKAINKNNGPKSKTHKSWEKVFKALFS